MNVNNTPFDEWLDEISQLLDYSSQKYGLFQEKTIARKVKPKPRWYKFHTQQIRRELARNLGDLHDVAQEYAKNTRLKPKERERWTRVSAYVVQTINSILNAHDEVSIEKAIYDLKEYVKQHVETT